MAGKTELKTEGKEGVSSWTQTSDFPSWTFTTDRAGEYAVTLAYTAEKKQGGRAVVVVNEKVSPEFSIAPTGKQKKDRLVTVAIANLKPGTHTVSVKARKIKDKSLMQLKKVFIGPVKGADFIAEEDLTFIKHGLPLSGKESYIAWINAMVEARKRALRNPSYFGRDMWKAFPLMCDWFLQDNQIHGQWGDTPGFDSRKDFATFLKKDRKLELESKLIAAVAKDLGIAAPSTPATRTEALKLYLKLCHKRRAIRLKPLREKTNAIVYAKHMNMGTIYLATESQGSPKGSKLHTIDLDTETDEVLFDSENGIVRDPEVSFDGKKMLFAWRKTNQGINSTGRILPETDNYKIYEMDLNTRKMRQLTTDETYGADTEPCYLPNGDIMFSSLRCVQEVTCGWGDCSNLFVMNKDGKYARRLGFDQTQTAFPHLLDDGRIVYTRRDYNDRGQTYAHSLFVMNIDGTVQTEYYGNNTTEPTSLQHTRSIPGTGKTISIAGGYHTTQGGKLVIIDPKKGLQKYQGLTFIGWDHKKKKTGGDSYGREGDQYVYPYPLSETGLLVGYSPIGCYLFNKEGRLDTKREHGMMRYKLYYMNLDGTREMLAADPVLSCGQAAPIAPRKKPAVRASSVDYSKDTGTLYVQNVYFGPSAEGIKPGTIKKIRVNELYYKPVTIGGACWGPPRDQVGVGKKYSSIGQHSITPVGVGTASFDAKGILGEVDVHADGSAMFEVPARTPIYLQLIDENGYVAQTMRSWTTLMPNEKFSCVGCHEDKNSAPLAMSKKTVAMTRRPQKLQAFHDVSGKPFSYAKMIQPIFNKHCVTCHAPGKKAEKIDLTDTIVADSNIMGSNATMRNFYKSYLTLLKADKWRGKGKKKRLETGMPNEWIDYYTRLLTVEQTPAYYAGSAKSGLLKMLKKGHPASSGHFKAGKDIRITQAELDKIAAWIDLNVPFIGEYDEMNNWSDEHKTLYKDKMAIRAKQEAIEAKNIKAYITDGQP
ncbi:hypothetical protein BVY04_03685 [bacterium M21]|nr:hypothetical protein BVY04_03685 [bacterium M21]